MKAVRFNKRSNNGIYYFNLQIDTKMIGEKISKGIIITYVGVSMICGLASVVALFHCIDTMSISWGQFFFILITGFIFMSLMRIISKDIFIKMENNFKKTCLDIWKKISCSYDKN